MTNQVTQGFDVGINNDRWEFWRNNGEIGYVHLAFKVITSAIYDLIAGDTDDLISANYFFYGNDSPVNGDGESLYWLWADVLGIDGLPETVVRHQRYGYVSQEEVDFFWQLCTTMKTI